MIGCYCTATLLIILLFRVSMATVAIEMLAIIMSVGGHSENKSTNPIIA